MDVRGCTRALLDTGKRWPQPRSTTSAFLSAPCSAPPTDCNFACTFDKDFCGWVQADSSSLNWIRNKGPTPTPNTGPSSDHTTGGRNGNPDTGRGVSPQRWQQTSNSEHRPRLSWPSSRAVCPVSLRARGYTWEGFQPWQSVCAPPRADEDLPCRGECNAQLDDVSVSGEDKWVCDSVTRSWLCQKPKMRVLQICRAMCGLWQSFGGVAMSQSKAYNCHGPESTFTQALGSGEGYGM